MRDAMGALGGDPTRINPLVPAELVIDHSVVADVAGRPDAFVRNVELEFERNRERYAFLRWGQQAFADFKVVPPGHRHLPPGQPASTWPGWCSPTTAARPTPTPWSAPTRHTPMVNGLGVLGWGVGGIEAEAAMLGQPISMLMPKVVGFKLSGELPEGSTATDLVLTVTELLRRHGVVGKFVEFYGPGVGNVPVENRATIGNMSPEYGSTCTIFPIDAETLRYLQLHRPPARAGRPGRGVRQGAGPVARPGRRAPLLRDASSSTWARSCRAWPGRAGPRTGSPSTDARRGFRAALADMAPADADRSRSTDGPDEASAESFPASDPPAAMAGTAPDEQPRPASRPAGSSPTRPGPAAGRATRVPVALEDGTRFDLDHGHVVIAAITSCTNTSNPSVMLAAGLLARNAVDRGLASKPWVKTSLAPGSKVVMDYYERAGLLPYLEKLGFHLVGFGCTTCIGNSGPAGPRDLPGGRRGRPGGGLGAVAATATSRAASTPTCRMNYLASPPLVVAYALAGTMDIDLLDEPLGHDPDGKPVYLRDLWPSSAEVAELIGQAVQSDMFRKSYGQVFEGDERWNTLEVPTGESFAWDDASTYVRRPPYFDGMPATPEPVTDIHGARVLAVLGDSVTTDHISPAGVIKRDSPAGRYLIEQGVEPRDFNSYGSRRGNHEVMIRGTFANIRLRNRLAPGTEGGVTLHLPDGEQMTHLRRGHALPGRRRAAGGPGRQGVRLGVQPRLGGQGPDAARGPGGAGRELRAHPPVQPGRHGRPAPGAAGRRDGRVARPHRPRDLRDHRPGGRRRRRLPPRGHRPGRRPGAHLPGPHRHPERGRVLPPRRHPPVRPAPAPGLTGMGEPEVSLREITADTVREVCRLRVAPGQEGFVAPVAESIAEAYFSPLAWFRAVYAGDTPVGFVMLEDDAASRQYFLWRLLIDARHQGKGYGRAPSSCSATTSGPGRARPSC